MPVLRYYPVVPLSWAAFRATGDDVTPAQAKRSIAPVLVTRNTVLVLPCAHHSAAGDRDYFFQGITQEIIRTLTRVEAVRLVTWSGARGTDHPDIREVAAEA